MVQAARRKFHFIYKTICLITDRYYYGIHSTDDMDDGYLGSGQRLIRSVKKHGRENHVREVHEMLPDRKSLRRREAEIVDGNMLKDPMCMNLALGGVEPPNSIGIKRSEEFKKKVSASKMGKKHTEQARKNMGDSHRGHKHSEEAKRKMSEKAKEREARKKAEGYTVSAETRAKMSASHAGENNHFFGRKHSEESRQRMREAKREVIATAA